MISDAGSGSILVYVVLGIFTLLGIRDTFEGVGSLVERGGHETETSTSVTSTTSTTTWTTTSSTTSEDKSTTTTPFEGSEGGQTESLLIFLVGLLIGIVVTLCFVCCRGSDVPPGGGAKLERMVARYQDAGEISRRSRVLARTPSSPVGLR